MKKDNVTTSKKNDTIKILNLSKKNDRKEFKKEVKETLEKVEFDTVVHF